MHTTFVGVGLEHPIIAQRFAGGTQQGQQDNREGVDQPQPITPLGGFDMHRRQSQTEAQILTVSQTAFDSPATAVESGQLLGGGLGVAGGQAPSLLHIGVLHADHGAHPVAIRGDLGTAQQACASAGLDPVGGGAIPTRPGRTPPNPADQQSGRLRNPAPGCSSRDAIPSYSGPPLRRPLRVRTAHALGNLIAASRVTAT
jgi:hypothetical protein